MESDRWYYRCKLKHDDIVTIVVLAHRKTFFMKIYEYFLKIRSKEVVNMSSSVGIVTVNHSLSYKRDRQ